MENQIGNIISQYRQNRKMTQEEFASRLGVTPQAVSKWERGNGLPDMMLFVDICRLLDVSADTLLGLQTSSIVENSSVTFEREIRENIIAEPIVIEFGEDIIPCFVEGLETDFINQKRRKLAIESGMLMPILHIRDNIELGKTEYQIKCYDKIMVNNKLDIDNDNKMAGFEQIIEQMYELCREHYDEILNKELVKKLVDNMKEQHPGVADDLIPEKISYLMLEKRLKEIARDKGNIRDLIHILEEMEETYRCTD